MNADAVKAAADALSGQGYPYGAPTLAGIAVAAAEPIIRADERAATRAAIAAEIRAEADRQDAGMLVDYGQHNPCDAAWRRAARIAEGTS